MGGFNQAYSVKNIAVYLFSQEYERTVSFFGTVYTKEHLFGPVADGAITFSTKKEGSNFSEFLSVIRVASCSLTWNVILF